MSDDTEPDDENIEFARLLEEASAADPHDLQAQEALGMALLASAGEWAEAQVSTPYTILHDTFLEVRARGDWGAAEDACRRLLTLADVDTQPCKIWGDLAGVLTQQGRWEEAYQAIQAATEAARASDVTPLITTALETEATWAESRQEYSHAQTCLEEALQRLACAEYKQDWLRAGFLVQRARLRLREGALEQAAQDLETAEPELQPYANSMMLTGPLSRLESWWDVTAQLRLAQEDHSGAHTAAEEALWIARRIAEFPHLDLYDRRLGLHRALKQFAELQDSLGDTKAAEAAQQEASAIK